TTYPSHAVCAVPYRGSPAPEGGPAPAPPPPRPPLLPLVLRPAPPHHPAGCAGPPAGPAARGRARPPASPGGAPRSRRPRHRRGRRGAEPAGHGNVGVGVQRQSGRHLLPCSAAGGDEAPIQQVRLRRRLELTERPAALDRKEPPGRVRHSGGDPEPA